MTFQIDLALLLLVMVNLAKEGLELRRQVRVTPRWPLPWTDDSNGYSAGPVAMRSSRVFLIYLQ